MSDPSERARLEHVRTLSGRYDRWDDDVAAFAGSDLGDDGDLFDSVDDEGSDDDGDE